LFVFVRIEDRGGVYTGPA